MVVDYCSMPTVPSMSISSSPQREYFRRGEVINFSVICESGSSRTVVGLCEELTMSSGKWNTTFNCSVSEMMCLLTL